ncbi:hypothetical protein SAMN05518672_101858 [Chitinophaga sp. CF118]|nr:hypothetical protein SAMN05518672_101858 [Chitinophaga sp. CF118]
MLGFIIVIPILLIFIFIGEFIGRVLAGIIFFIFENIKIILAVLLVGLIIFVIVKSQNSKKYYYPKYNNQQVYPTNRY